MFELQPEEIGDSHPLVTASINAEDALLATAGTGNKTHAANVGYLLADNTPAFLVFSKSTQAETLAYLRNLCTCSQRLSKRTNNKAVPTKKRKAPPPTSVDSDEDMDMYPHGTDS
jgi:hypothetical protein